MLTWEENGRFALGDATFLTMPSHDAFSRKGNTSLREGEFFLFKPRSLVERYVALIADLKPQRIFELGILQGGNTLCFAELARPRRIAAIDRLPLESFKRKLQGYVGSAGLADVVRLYGEVDQADRLRLAGIVDEAFGGAALDLVVDDCSHLYEPTRASFNELFPRLRPAGPT